MTAALIAFGRDSEHTLNESCACRFLKGDVLEKGADGGHAQVAGAGAVAPAALYMIQEGPDKGGVEIVQSDFGRWFVKLFFGKHEKQPERIAVRGNSVWACRTLTHKAVGEKRLKMGGYGGGSGHAHLLPSFFEPILGLCQQFRG